MNIELLNNLYDAYDFLYVDNEYSELIDKFENDTESCKEKYLRMKNEKAVVFPVYLAAFYAAMVLFIIGGLLTSQPGILSVFGTVMLGIGVFVIIVAVRIAKQRKKMPEKKALDFWNSVGSQTCIENETKITKIKNELAKFRAKNEKVIDFLPEDYQDIYAVGYMIHVIKNGLADTIKEALKLYTEQKHRWEMESAVHGMARAMELHNREMETYMSEISAQQRITNSRLADIEFLTFLDYMDR